MRVGVMPIRWSAPEVLADAEYTSASDVYSFGTVRVFRQKFTLEDAIGAHACSLEASRRVTNVIPLSHPLFLPVHAVNCVQTLKVS
jgi:hypothetical protein